MYLAELDLHGFKSFAQRTKLKFDDGITAIVGPNGCGKSNIVDSLRWVLGEQRPSLLRSSSMSNVIFNGTKQRKPLGMAEVSVTIQNNKGILPTEYTDITITRRLYRSGESEYLLNRTVCRLKDIIDLFMDTGMGSNAYSVIELKMVEDILSDKNQDRRRLFEEAAGITKYKEKRKVAFRKLDETTADLNRVEDILVEIRKKTRSLEIQAGKAQRAQDYKQRLEVIELGLAKHDYQNLSSRLSEHLKLISEAEKSKNEMHRKLDAGEQQLTVAKQELLEKERARNHAQQNVLNLQQEINQSRTQLQILKERIVNEENTIQQYDLEIGQSDLEILEIKKSITTLETRLEHAQEKLTKAAVAREEAEKQYLERREKSNALREEIDKLNQEQRILGMELTHLQSTQIRLESKIESRKEDTERINRQISKIQEEINTQGTELEQHEELLTDRIKRVERAEEMLEETRKERERLLNLQNELKDKYRQAKSKLDSVESEMVLLQSIADSNDIYPESVRFLKEHKAEFATLEVVSDVFSTTETYALALDAALGQATSYVIVENMQEAELAVEMLRQNKLGKATFIPLDRIQKSYPAAEGAISTKVKTKKKFQGLRDLMLGQVLVFSDAKEARQFCYQNNKTGVTVDGETITPNGFYRGGSTSPNEGMRLAFEDRMEKLEKEAIRFEEEQNSLRQKLDETDVTVRSIDLNALQQQLKMAERERGELRSKVNNLSARVSFGQKSLEELKSRLENLEGEEDSQKLELGDIQPKIEQLESKVNRLISTQVEKKSEMDQLEEIRNRAQESYNQTLVAFQQTQSEVDQIEAEIDRSHRSISSIKEQLKRRSESAHQAKDRIITYRKDIKSLEQKAEQLQETKQVADREFEEFDAQCKTAREHIDQQDSGLRDLRIKREETLEKFHQLELIKSQLDAKITALADSIWEDYGLLMDQLKQELPDDLQAEDARDEVQTLKSRLKNLGEVNPLAIDEYKEEKERLDFYEEQVNDLLDADQKLRQSIREINETAQQRFMETFNQIRENFIEVFKTLFDENDECDLILEANDDDPLDARIEILAKPRGKRPSTIMQLSGGEKTLTAIALLFAIYLVKPSPFCILDEVDAPLDDANIERFAKILYRFSNDTQFIVITHNKKTMEKANMMYGVTMQETGVSSLVGVEMDEYQN